MADEEKNGTQEETPEEPVAEAEEPAAEEPTTSEEVQAEADQVEADAEPAAEEPAVEEAPAEAPAEEAPAVQGKKRRRVPRPQRRQRPKQRVPSTERKPIVRQPKPEQERGRRLERRGIVVSAAMDKTIVVRVDAVRAHPKYKKVIRRSQKFHAHDEQNTASVGDTVRIVETRPLSKTKRWRLAEVLEVAK